MSENISVQSWWSLSPSEFPHALMEDRRTMEATRLRTLLSGTDGGMVDGPWLRLRRAATLLELSALDKQDESSTKVWEIIALMHEAIGVIDSERQDYQWLLSALAWQLAEAPSIAALLASRLITREDFGTRDIIEQIAIAFSRRNFHTLRGLAELAIDAGDRLKTEVNDSKDWACALETGMLLSLGTAMRDLARYVSFLHDELPNLSSLGDFLKLAGSAGVSRRFRIGQLLTNCVYKFANDNSRMLIEQTTALSGPSKQRIHKYLRHYPELWPSQRDAIANGLLDSAKKHFVVAVPTSSGKTLCGELAIIQEITDNPFAVCFYVVPTRALVEEKSRELKSKLNQFNFKVAAATGALQQDEIEASLFKDAQVIVCTPEKLDLLIRHSDASLMFASLFIIDETQMINDDDRGLGLEFVVVKLLLLYPDARILLLSAMLPNSEDFGRWLSQDATVSSSTWRPTRQRFGEIEFRKLKPRGVSLEIALYDTSGEFDGLRIPIQQYSRQPSSVLEKVIWAVEALRVKGPVLVFSMAKSRCELIVEKIVEYLKEQRANYPIKVEYSPSSEVEALRRKIKREISDNFLLGEALALGVAYHHADLPPRIRVDLEHLIANNLVEVVVSTTTLAEGVNLPISTVIYEDWMTHVDARTSRRPEPLDLSKFRNIAGRAGRAGKEAEGLILFLDPARKPVKLLDRQEMSPREYFIRQTYPPIQSRFLEIINDYEVPDDAELDRTWENSDLTWDTKIRRALRQFGLAVLHALEVLQPLDDQTLVERVINHSLLAVQAPDKRDQAKEWFGKWVRFYRRVQLEKEELRPIAMQIGLPLRAVQRLYARAVSRPEVLRLFEAANSNELTLSEEQINAATKIVAEIEELDWNPANAPHNRMLAAWLNGTPIESLTEMYVPHLTETTRLIERTCNYVTQQLSNAGAWGMYALARTLELILGKDQLSPIAKRLPLFIYFGVNTTPAALLSIMGIERIDSLRLGAAFLADGHTEVSISLLKTWAKDVGIERLMEILSGPDRREVDRETIIILGAD